MEQIDLSFDEHVEVNGKDYRICRDKCGGYLRISGTRPQYDFHNKFPVAQFVDRFIKIDVHGRLGKKILARLMSEKPSVFQKCQEADNKNEVN
jgi:hypothetical protein